MHWQEGLYRASCLSVNQHALSNLATMLQELANFTRVNIERCSVNVHKGRQRMFIKQTVGRGYETEGGGDDLISGTDPERAHAQMQGGRAAAGCHRVVPPYVPGESLFEFR